MAAARVDRPARAARPATRRCPASRRGSGGPVPPAGRYLRQAGTKPKAVSMVHPYRRPVMNGPSTPGPSGLTTLLQPATVAENA